MSWRRMARLQAAETVERLQGAFNAAPTGSPAAAKLQEALATAREMAKKQRVRLEQLEKRLRHQVVVTKRWEMWEDHIERFRDVMNLFF